MGSRRDDGESLKRERMSRGGRSRLREEGKEK